MERKLRPSKEWKKGIKKLAEVLWARRKLSLDNGTKMELIASLRGDPPQEVWVVNITRSISKGTTDSEPKAVMKHLRRVLGDESRLVALETKMGME